MNALETADDPLARVFTSNAGELEVERADNIRKLRTEVGCMMCWQKVYVLGCCPVRRSDMWNDEMLTARVAIICKD